MVECMPILYVPKTQNICEFPIEFKYVMIESDLKRKILIKNDPDNITMESGGEYWTFRVSREVYLKKTKDEIFNIFYTIWSILDNDEKDIDLAKIQNTDNLILMCFKHENQNETSFKLASDEGAIFLSIKN